MPISDARVLGGVWAWVVGLLIWGGMAAGQGLVVQPGTEMGLSAHRTVEAWVVAGAVGDLPVVRSEVPGLVGVRVTLRDRALLVGMGDAYVLDWDATEGDPQRPAELEPLLQEATAAAINHARRQMEDAAFRQQLARKGDVGEFADFKRIAPRVLVDVQVGYRPERIVLNAEDPPGVLLERYAAGYHGLRLKGVEVFDGAAAEASYEWPATGLSLGMTPLRQFRRLLHGQGLEDRDLVDVALPGGPVLSRFEVVHVVRPRRDRRPAALVRGNPAGAGGLLGMAEMQLLCDLLAEQLSGRTLFDGRVYGPYQPHTAKHVPKYSSDQAAGLTGLALARFAGELERRQAERRAKQQPGDPEIQADPRIEAYAGQARVIGVRLAAAVFGEDGAEGAGGAGGAGGAVAALALLSLSESPGVLADAEAVGLADQLAGHLVGLQRPDGSFVTRPGREREASQASAALFLAALSSWLERTADGEALMGLAGGVERGLERARERLAVRADVQAAPWLMLAENASARALARGGDAGRGLRLGQLAAVLEPLVNEHQIAVPPILGPADVLGGFLFVEPAFDAAPDPGWRSAVSGLFIAAALRNTGVVPADERQAPLLALGLAGRFLDKLTLKGAGLFMAIDHRATAGGVRRNLWDTTVTSEATAMTLLALTETSRAVSEVD
ncbi:MAG: hypothetical protein AAF750_11235 [Planctomycetota bacterium]